MIQSLQLSFNLGLEVLAMQPSSDAVEVEASISYVIDTTGSMSDELVEIQRAIPQIRIDLDHYVQSLGENIQVRFILVPFNDPGKFRCMHVGICMVGMYTV